LTTRGRLAEVLKAAAGGAGGSRTRTPVAGSAGSRQCSGQKRRTGNENGFPTSHHVHVSQRSSYRLTIRDEGQ
jgi:hypothetical protein